MNPRLQRLVRLEYEIYTAYQQCGDILLDEYGLLLLFKELMDGLNQVIERQEGYEELQNKFNELKFE